MEEARTGEFEGAEAYSSSSVLASRRVECGTDSVQ